MKKISPFQTILFTFLFLILIGTILLSLPSSYQSDAPSLIDTLFISTSAVCVTGLVPLDTAVTWSLSGQIIILLLIQIGGLGLITIVLLMRIYSGKKIGLNIRTLVQQSVSALQLDGVVKLVEFIVAFAVIAELTGAVLLAFVFIPEFGFGKGVFYAIFHSVSAFCNAGFDLMGTRQPFSSLTSMYNHPLVNIVIPVLIVTGGLGFLCFQDLFKNKFRFRKCTLHTKIVITMTTSLIVFGFLYFYIFEFRSWNDLNTPDKIMASVFTAITPRTAGFNTIDLTRLSESGQCVLILLMLIGASPGSTGGGIKTTTLFVLIASAISIFRDRSDIEFMERRIPFDMIRQAITVLCLYLLFFIVGGIAISRIENISLMTSFFETASALGTVGLTLGITPELSTASKLILICFMIFGRVGGMTFIHAAVVKHKNPFTKYPEENVTIG